MRVYPTVTSASNSVSDTFERVLDTVERGSHLFPHLDVFVVVVPRIVKVLAKLPNPASSVAI